MAPPALRSRTSFEAEFLSGQVLHVAPRDVVDRFGRMIRHLVLALSAEGWRISLVTDEPTLREDLDGTPVRCFVLPSVDPLLRWRLPYELEHLVGPPPQFVHLWGARHAAAWARWTRRREIPLLVQVLGVSGLAPAVHVAPQTHTRCVIISEELRRLALASWPGAATLPLAIPPGLLTPDGAPEEEPASDHILSVVWAGQIRPGRGVTCLVEAVRQLRQQGQELHVALVGATGDARAVWSRIRAAGVADVISLVHDARVWDPGLRGVDVCVVPQREEDIQLAPLLAMALGKIVISSRNQIPEWFVEERTCWQFTPGAPIELAFQMGRAAQREPASQSLRASAAAHVREHYTIGGRLGAWLVCYESLVEVDGRPLTPAEAAAEE